MFLLSVRRKNYDKARSPDPNRRAPGPSPSLLKPECSSVLVVYGNDKNNILVIYNIYSQEQEVRYTQTLDGDIFQQRQVNKARTRNACKEKEKSLHTIVWMAIHMACWKKENKIKRLHKLAPNKTSISFMFLIIVLSTWQLRLTHHTRTTKKIWREKKKSNQMGLTEHLRYCRVIFSHVGAWFC